MLFNSFGFALFLPVVFILYWWISGRRRTMQNVLLLAASYFFYGCWDWRFLFLLIFSTLLDYSTGLAMSASQNQRTKSFWFWLSVLVNLGFLGVFKYYNFFAESFAEAMGAIGFHVSPFTLSIVLPVGISFYTFHGLSYVIDIYKGRIPAERNFIDYSLFVSFFPLLVAGPIERATHLLPQIKSERTFDYSRCIDGLRQILWGLFKKVVIADQCAVFANTIFDHPQDYHGSTLLIGAVLFAFQIYGDFSGYSDIALGTARMFGIELLRNFAFPYFSRDIAEFWRRWHISLSTWFRDYLYIPLGGSRSGTFKAVRNTFIIFIVSGFWHGANWTFIAWGLLHAIYFLPLLLLKRNRNNIGPIAEGRFLPTLSEAFSIMITFGLTTLAWIFFRAESIQEALHYIAGIASPSLFSKPEIVSIPLFVLLSVFLLIEWMGRNNRYALEQLGLQQPRVFRWSFYLCIAVVVMLHHGEEVPFIYFQF